MLRLIAMVFWAVIALSQPLCADGLRLLGKGRLVNNDLYGDLNDRWQSGSVASSRIYGRDWQGTLPTRPFQILEFRLGAQIAAPADLSAPAKDDRRFAGAWSLGLHTHFQKGDLDFALGADLVITGPQTGLGAFQTALHDALSVPPAQPSVLEGQIGNGWHPTGVIEAGRDFALGRARLRPFAELRRGAESLSRIGADLTFGPAGQGELLVRDPITGQRYRAISAGHSTRSLVLGGDIAFVESSVFLPDGGGAKLTRQRSRLRAGMHWQRQDRSLFYGVTYLSKEFDAQPKGQMLGSLRLDLRF